MNPTNLNTSKANGTLDITDLPSVRLNAARSGITKYYTGKPCKRGHVTYRYTASGMCAECSAKKAKGRHAAGLIKRAPNRDSTNAKWNASLKAQIAKQRWKDKDPRRAWAVYATGAAKSRALRSNIPFDLDSAYVLNITPTHCPVLGVEFTFIGNKVLGPHSASLDKINPALGYIKGNVAVISMRANAIKSSANSSEVAAVAAWMKEQGV